MNIEMQQVILQRLQHTDQGTIGEMTLPDGTILTTVEPPWQDNKPHVSCIPAGTYTVRRDTTGRFAFYRLLNVDGRTDIEIHPANYFINPHIGKQELAGCIAPGLGRMPGYPVSVSRSGDACGVLLEIMGADDFELQIVAPDEHTEVSV